MMLYAFTSYLLICLSPALAQDTPINQSPSEAPEVAPIEIVDEHADFRAYRSCLVVLPPAPSGPPLQLPPLCAQAPADTRCIPPHRIQARQTRIDLPSHQADAEDPVEPPYTLMYTPGLEHVFTWLKLLNLCRYEASQGSLPEELSELTQPVKQAFQTPEQFDEEKVAYISAQQRRDGLLQDVHRQIEPLLWDTTFVAVLPIDSLGEYSVEENCFFPGPQIRVSLDDFKSQDTLYVTHDTTNAADEHPVDRFPLIPRRNASSVVLENNTIDRSETLASAAFDDETAPLDIVLQSHPLCFSSAEEGLKVYNQKEKNNITDFGIHFAATIQFRLDEDSQPRWLLSGEFINRDQPELRSVPVGEDEEERFEATDRVITVRPDAVKPIEEEEPKPDSETLIPIDDNSFFDCSTAPTRSGAGWLGVLGMSILWSRRRRR
jgi:MYXO-CTERM domain-containing protein